MTHYSPQGSVSWDCRKGGGVSEKENENWKV
nr:MAG TPA: hypothetical protein [Caudoviricetes sp.]DAT40781.1 MAG TPA: hypothetical protein [Caudoviricetes sp.]